MPRRIKHPSELAAVFATLGSNLNPILTQLAKTRRAVFVEGKDFQIISRFSRKLKSNRVANRADFAVVPVEGFNPERIRILIKGIETTIGGSIASAAILDRDYRSQVECEAITKDCEQFCSLTHIHKCKEIENFLLVPNALDRAAGRRLMDSNKRTGKNQVYKSCSEDILQEFSSRKKTFVTSRYLAIRQKFDKVQSPGTAETTSSEAALVELEELWKDNTKKFSILPGKEALSNINQRIQERYGVSITPTAIIDAMRIEEIPEEMRYLIDSLSDFSKISPTSEKMG